jgi:hypothetical protein
MAGWRKTAACCGGPHRQRLRWAVGIGVLRVHELLATRAAAAAWAASHSEITGGIRGQDRALQVGIGIFGQLLAA